MTYEEAKKEFRRPSFRNKMKSEIGGACVNCGADEDIEYHHIVPLKNGGTNNFGNIVPLCSTCHYKAHDRKNFNAKNPGRPKIVEFEEAEIVLHRYFSLEIGTKEAKELLGLSQKTKDSFLKLKKQYEEKYNIEKFKNNIDLINSQRKRLESYKLNK